MGITTADRKKAFLIAFGECGRLAIAAKAAGTDPRQTQTWRKKDREFARKFDDAELLALRALEDKAYEIALEGEIRMLIFLLELRLRHKYGRRLDIDFDQMTDDELIALANAPARE